MPPLTQDLLRPFCRKWRITALELFGSLAQGTGGDSSDVDLLVTFDPEAPWSLLDHIDMQRELAELLGRPVDLVSRRAVERSHNPIRKRSILDSAKTVYAE